MDILVCGVEEVAWEEEEAGEALVCGVIHCTRECLLASSHIGTRCA